MTNESNCTEVNDRSKDEAHRLTEDILDKILSLSSLDFSKVLDVGFEDSVINAVAVGLNMLGEELKRSVVSIEYVNSILESMNDSLLVINPTGTIRTINTYCAKLLGYSKDNLTNANIDTLITRESFYEISGMLSGVNTENPHAFNVVFRSKSNQDIPMQINASVIYDKNGVISCLLMVGRDMRETLALIDKAESATNAEKRRSHELSLAHLELELAHDRLEQQVLERTKELRIANQNLNIEIEERKRAELEVRAREEKFRNIFEMASVAILEVDLSLLLKKLAILPVDTKKNFRAELSRDNLLLTELSQVIKIIDTNHATLTMFGAKDKAELSSRLDELIFEKSYQGIEYMLVAIEQKRDYLETHCSFISLDKKELDVLIQLKMYPTSSSGIGSLVTIIDLTETKSLKEQLRQSQKMEAVGRIAGGIAHDFNNLLTVILSYGQMVLDDLPEGSEPRSRIEPMVECSERAADLTKQLLAFSRRQLIEPKIIDLNDLIANMEKMLKRVLGEDIELIGIRDNNLAKIKADVSQIEQVIMNLVVNARDAMVHGGKLMIETKNVNLTSDELKSISDLAPGPYVLLAVSDTGSAMSPEVQARIFEPFFTTKGVGNGTGLGLSTVYGIVKQNNGHLEVLSELGRGTVFKIYLPISLSEGEAIKAISAKPQKDALIGNGTIFVVEDEDSVRMVATAILKKNGYQVLTASDPLEAIEMLASYKGHIDLLLSDVIMPNMKGSQMAESICALRPGLKVLFMSGYTDNAINQNGLLDQGKEFLQKPFTPQSLLLKVKSLLKPEANN